MGSSGRALTVSLELRLAALVLLATLAPPGATCGDEFVIERRIPPPGIELSADDRASITDRLRSIQKELATVAKHPRVVDAEIYAKAVSYAVMHNEFYRSEDMAVASAALDECQRRLALLRSGRTPWATARGLVVRGYRSRIDDSIQPYGLWIAEDADFTRPVPLYVWLHGRGDKVTDLHFMRRRQTNPGTITPPGAIVLHPFGRHCIGFKSAGEVDVLEAIEDVAALYPIDRDRIALMGFSMGGAGAWHIGAHYADRWAAVSPGAGFAETAKYNRLTAASFPVWYEQTLWGLYDVPGYVRNLFNLPVIAYSGENDKQIQAARVMEEAFREWGQELTHLIGPGMGHKYHPDTLREIMQRVGEAIHQGRPTNRRKITLQTRTLRYSRFDWVKIRAMGEHWLDGRVDAEVAGDRKLRVATENVRALRLSPFVDMRGAEIEIDGQTVTISDAGSPCPFADLHFDGIWRAGQRVAEAQSLHKKPGLQGPIDDLFLEPFLVVVPTGTAWNPRIQEWVDFELAHFRDRWRALFRGELRTKSDSAVTEDDLADFHCVLWGDPNSNSLLARVLEAQAFKAEALETGAKQPPIRWDGHELRVGTRSFSASDHVPIWIYPNPLNPDKYIAVNSGPTFREAHDRTNSLQNPKLPDWAIVDVRQKPDAAATGRIVAADFFDEHWQLRTVD